MAERLIAPSLVARMFLGELAFTALGITALFITLFNVSAKDEYGADLYEDEEKQIREKAEALEKVFGAKARKILSGRYRKPVSVRPSRVRPS